MRRRSSQRPGTASAAVAGCGFPSRPRSLPVKTTLVPALLFAALIAAPAHAAVPGAVPAAVAKAVADPSRPKADTDTDALRDPADTLAFAGLKPGMTVIE